MPALPRTSFPRGWIQSDPTVRAAAAGSALKTVFAAPGFGEDVDQVAEYRTALVEAAVPGNTFSGAAKLVVDDLFAGQSTPVTSTFYQPEVTVALPV